MKWAVSKGEKGNPPPIPLGYASWVEDFFELSTDRQITGYGCGPIPAASIERRAVDMGADEADMFRACIRKMDEAFREAIQPGENAEGESPEILKRRKPTSDMTPAKFDAIFGG